MHQVAVLFSLADKPNPWIGVARSFVEHQHLFFFKSIIHSDNLKNIFVIFFSFRTVIAAIQVRFNKCTMNFQQKYSVDKFKVG